MAPSGASPLASVIDANNLLQLIQIDTYLAQLNKQLRVGVPRNARDALDMAGKLPLALKAHSIGIPAEHRGARSCRGDRTYARSCRGDRTFQFSRLRSGTPFEHLLLVARSRNPTDWTDLHQLDHLFWLGYVSRAAFDRALAGRRRAQRHQAAIQAQHHQALGDQVQQDNSDDAGDNPGEAEVKANVTIGSRRRSWLGSDIQWVRFEDLTR